MKSYRMFRAWIAWKSPNEKLRIGHWGGNLAGKKYYSARHFAESNGAGGTCAPPPFGVDITTES